MKIFIVHGNHPTVQGDPMQVHATKEGANAYAAELVNIFLTEYTDDDDVIILAADATAETWEAKCLEYRQHIADDQGRDLDHLDDEDAGDVWIIEDVLHGGDALYGKHVRDAEGAILTPILMSKVYNPWDGSAEPPAADGTHVDVKLRCGVERSGIIGQPGYARRWTHLNSPDDIIGFITVTIVECLDPADIKPIIGTKHEG